MSLQGLISGSECAVPFNPLSQVLKHTEGDRSLQQDRIAGSSSSRLHHLPSSSAAAGAERDLALARQFFEGNAQQSASGPAPAILSHIPPQMSGVMDPAMRASPDLSKAWNEMALQSGFRAQIHRSDVGNSSTSGWTAEFGRTSSVAVSGPAQSTALQRPDYSQTSYMSQGLYSGGMARPMMYGSSFNAYGNPLQALDKGKGKGKEIDFEAAFAEATASLTSNQAGGARIVEVGDDVSNVTESLQSASLDQRQDEAEEPSMGSDFQTLVYATFVLKRH